MPTTTDKWDEIAQKLDVLIFLVACTVGADKPLAERAPLLQRAGLDRGTIAAVCNSTPNAVSVRLAEAKKRGGKKRAR